MTRAIKVADANARRQEQTYFWISNEQALFLRHTPDTRHPSAPRYYDAIEVDRATGTETRLNAFNGRYRSWLIATRMHCHLVDEAGNLMEPVETVYLPPTCALSPDGKWLLWHSHAVPPMWIAATVDGAGERKWPDTGELLSNQMQWLHDSRRWLTLYQSYQRKRYRFIGAVIHSLEDAVADQPIRLGDVPDGMVLGITEVGDLLIARYPYGERAPQVDFSACGMHPGVAVTRDYTVPLPTPLAVHGLALSPQGDRMAWLLGDMDNRLVAGAIVGLWVSDLKGRDMREVDCVPVIEQATEGERTHFDLPAELRWLPDGAHLSFLYRNALWVVPIEREQQI
ncbi:MAG TPA: hypothetical protein VKU00_12525 [Chthonomonadaceae bacterium]|nr:hypothetical protein [Chthonomonadaceae bacterium]